MRWGSILAVWGTAAVLVGAAGQPQQVSPYDLGNRYFLQQKYPLALAQYEEALRQGPTAPWAADAQFFAGQCLLLTGQKAKAIRAFEATLRKYPSSTRADEARIFLADIYASVGRWRDAMNHLLQAARRPPPHLVGADAHYALGLLYMEPANPQRNVTKAIEHYRRVISGWPTSDRVPLAYLGIGHSYLAIGQSQQAADIATNVIRKYPRTRWEVAARTLLASSLNAQGRPQEAIKQQQQAITSLVPPSPLSTQQRTVLPACFWAENITRRTLPLPGPAGLAVRADSMSSDQNRLNLRGGVLIQAPPGTDLGRPFTISAQMGWIDTPGGLVTCSGKVVFDSVRRVPNSEALDRIKVQSHSFTVLIVAKQATARGSATLQRWLGGKTETARGEQIVISLKTGTYKVAAPLRQSGKKLSK